MLLWGNKGHSDNSLTVGVSDTLVVVDFYRYLDMQNRKFNEENDTRTVANTDS